MIDIGQAERMKSHRRRRGEAAGVDWRYWGPILKRRPPTRVVVIVDAAGHVVDGHIE